MQANNLANRTNEPTDWQSIDWKETNRVVRNLRHRIFRATQEGDWTKVRSLQKLMLRSRSNVLLAVRRVTQENKGKKTPGVDGVTATTPKERAALVDELLTYTVWKAKPTKRVYIPKSNGKQRPLGIPVILDRCAQAIVKNALEPLCESVFEGISYGFRPGRSAHDAIAKIFSIANSRGTRKWILDADISGAFDNISHEFLLEQLHDQPGRELIKQWLKAGYVDKNVFHETESGTPQGGVISPLLANIALHGMEEALGIEYTIRKHGTNSPRLENQTTRAVVRYADDFVIFCKTKEDAYKCKELLKIWLAERGLALSEEKTKVVHITEGFDFLGFNVRQYNTSRTKTGWKLLIKPSKKSVARITERLRNEWKALNGQNEIAVIETLNPIIRGWANYHKTVVSSKTFSNLDNWMFKREIRFVNRMHPNKSTGWTNARYFGKHNLNRDDKWVFGNAETHRYLLKFAWFQIERHVMVIDNYSPDDPTLTKYWLERVTKPKAEVNVPLDKNKLAERQAGRCPICGETLWNDEELQIHHIKPTTDPTRELIRNKRLLHLCCHHQVTAQGFEGELNKKLMRGK